MSEAPPATAFAVYFLEVGGTPGRLVGGSYDEISSIHIAVACIARYDQATCVVNKSTDKIIAFVGVPQD